MKFASNLRSFVALAALLGASFSNLALSKPLTQLERRQCSATLDTATVSASKLNCIWIITKFSLRPMLKPFNPTIIIAARGNSVEFFGQMLYALF